MASGRSTSLGITGGLVVLCLSGPSTSLAADVSDPALQTEDGWHVYWPTYLWAAGSNGTARTLPPLPEAKVDLSFSDSIDALKDLEVGLISTVFLRNRRVLLMGDINWMRLSPEQSVEVEHQSARLKFYSESLTVMSAVGYRLFDDEKLIVDAYVGAKYWYMDNSAQVKPAAVTPSRVETAESWVDAVVGAQLRSDITDHVFVNAVGFVGAGGSKLFTDVYGGIGYQFTEKWDAFAGYRIMHDERDNRDFSYDVTQHGPLLGVAAKF